MSQTDALHPVLDVQSLSIGWRNNGTTQNVVKNVSFSIYPGEVVALVGESGSGKTTTAQAIIGLLAENGERQSGTILLNGVDISGWSEKRLQAIRGVRISLIPQDPGSSLNPVKNIGDQLAEVLVIHQRLSRQQRETRVVELLARVGLTHPELRARQYPHELSGGMKQRVLIAIAIALRPALIVADEPTSALDVTVQKRILDLIDELRREFGTAVLFVTHDLAVAAGRADRLLVFRQGEVQEQGKTADLLHTPQHAYTRQLFADAPSLRTRVALPLSGSFSQPAIEVKGLSKTFMLGGKRQLRALDNVSFTVASGSTHALVGESGSGKTTLARILLGFQQPDAGQVLIDGIDITRLRGEALRQIRQKIQLVYQNPFSSLDPSQTLYKVIEEPLLNFSRIPGDERQRRVEQVAERVALPVELLQRKPRELSGGQRQRVAIARALILNPQILILDEATSALDVTVQAQILRLLQQLQQQLGLTYLFISHDLATVRLLAHRASVLKNGQQVDYGDIDAVFSQPSSTYTRALLDAIPSQKPADKDFA